MTVAKHIDELMDAACRVLEDQVFMFGEPCDKDDLDEDVAHYVMVSVRFDGPIVGQCFWIAPKAFGTELAANMLGVDIEDPAAISGGCDAMKELSNVVCCQFLTSVYGTEPIFHLDSPVSEPLNYDGWSLHINSQDTVGIVIEDIPVLLGLVLQSRSV